MQETQDNEDRKQQKQHDSPSSSTTCYATTATKTHSSPVFLQLLMQEHLESHCILRDTLDSNFTWLTQQSFSSNLCLSHGITIIIIICSLNTLLSFLMSFNSEAKQDNLIIRLVSSLELPHFIKTSARREYHRRRCQNSLRCPTFSWWENFAFLFCWRPHTYKTSFPYNTSLLILKKRRHFGSNLHSISWTKSTTETTNYFCHLKSRLSSHNYACISGLKFGRCYKIIIIIIGSHRNIIINERSQFVSRN